MTSKRLLNQAITPMRMIAPSVVAVLPFAVLLYLLWEMLIFHQPNLLQSLHEWGISPQGILAKYRLLGLAVLLLIVALLRMEQKWIRRHARKQLTDSDD